MSKTYETNRLILREWQDKDTEPFIALNQDPQVMEFYPSTYTKEHSIQTITAFKEHMDKYGYYPYVCELKSNGQFVGVIGLVYRNDLPFSPCVEITYRFNTQFWGQGLVLEAATKCLEIGFTEFNLSEIVSFTAKLNKRSERLMQKLGMTYVKEFYHPRLKQHHPLALHVLYSISNNKTVSQ